MIAIANSAGILLRIFPEQPGKSSIGLHRAFGWISEDGAAERARNRRRYGLKPHQEDWLLKLNVQKDKLGKILLEPIFGCSAESSTSGAWTLASPQGEFIFSMESPGELLPLTAAPQDNPRTLWSSAILFFLVFATMLAITYLQKPAEKVEEVAAEPVTVKIVKPERMLVMPTPKMIQTLQTAKAQAVKAQEVRQVLKKNLGFLEAVGHKDLSKAVGGTPSQLKDASPGAGAGGKEGSGGELLVGLGAGIRKTTVGNTGVAGLGGIGTKGRGGGQGGYGDIQVAGGQGTRMSNIPLSNDMMVEGGLTQGIIQATIAKYLSQVRACYEQGLRKNPGLTGLVGTRMDINGAGDVDTAQITQSSLGSAEVEGCITERMRTWKFPKPVGGVKVRVNYPFLLKPLHS